MSSAIQVPSRPVIVLFVGVLGYMLALWYFDFFTAIKRGEHGQEAIQRLDMMRRPLLSLTQAEHNLLTTDHPAAAGNQIDVAIRSGRQALAEYVRISRYNHELSSSVEVLAADYERWIAIERQLLAQKIRSGTAREYDDEHTRLMELTNAAAHAFLTTMNTLGDGEIPIHADIARGRVAGRNLQVLSVALFIYLAGILFWLQWSKIRSQQKNFAEQLRLHELAHHDHLTGLPNRLLLIDRLCRATAESRRSHKRVGVLYVDLDDFKRVNDGFGHQAGDDLLKQTAQRLQSCVRETDTVARLSGDEFVVLLTNVADREASAKVAENILATLNRPFDLAGRTARVCASIGIALAPDHGETWQELVTAADTAMYDSKYQGKNRFQFAT